MSAAALEPSVWTADPDLGTWRAVPPLGAIRLEWRTPGTRAPWLATHRLRLKLPNCREVTIRDCESFEAASDAYWTITAACGAHAAGGEGYES